MLSGYEEPYEVTALRKDGTTFPAEIQGRMIDYQGRQVRVTSLRDITEHHHSKEALRKSEDNFRTLFSSIPDHVTIYRKDGMILYVHVPEGWIHRISNKHTAGKFLTDTHDPDSAVRIQKRIVQTLNKGEIQNFQFSITKDNETFYYDTRYNPLGPDTVVTILRDTTNLKKIEQQLLKMQKLESIGVLAGGIAHDFNNILTGVLGNISMALSEMDAEDETTQILKESESAVLRAKSLTHQLLTFSKGGKPVKRTTDLCSMLYEIVKFALRGSNVKAEFEIQNDLPQVEVDSDQISQAIQNIVTNADHAMPEGGILSILIDSIYIKESDSPPVETGTYLRIRFKDQGIGIPEDHLERIFDPYFTTKQAGSGLGLASSFSIVKNHGGLIDVQSSVGHGAEFTLLLPATQTAPKEKVSVSPKQHSDSGHILIMDDEKMIQKLVQKITPLQ